MSAELSVYRELADVYQQEGQSQLRDRFLLLAAQAAQAAGDGAEADRLRQRLLQFNPHHMIKPFVSFADATHSPDVESYLRDLKVSYPLDVAKQMLAALRQATLRQELPEPTLLNEDDEDDDEEDDFDTARPSSPQQRPVQPPQKAEKPRTQPSQPSPAQQSPAPYRMLPPSAPPKVPPAAPAARRPISPPQRSVRTPEAVRPSSAEAARGSWFATFLFVVVFLLGAALGGYTLLRPFFG